MAIFVRTQKISETDHLVDGIHYYPEMLDELELSKGYLIEEPPLEETRQGYYTQLHYNPQTGELWYEYIEAPPRPEEIRDQRISDLEVAIAAILGGAV